ncbi:MAG: DUF4388 domain-containing protein [Bradymonadales bacterium]|nr:DUF4388 domain-containing protein [Bradymonadales bacterium]
MVEAGEKKRAAFHGSLRDLGVVDLIQFPNYGRKTGLLVITGTTDEALLYYEEGQLTHVRVGTTRGIEALSLVVDWAEGIFAYYPDIRIDRRTIELEFDRALLQAISKEEETSDDASGAELVQFPPLGEEPDIQPLVEEFTAAHPQILHLCVLRADGTLIAQSLPGSHTIERLDLLTNALAQFSRTYPGPRLTRLILEEERWTGVLARISRGRLVLLLADRRATLGMVTVAASRVVNLIEGKAVWTFS